MKELNNFNISINSSRPGHEEKQLALISLFTLCGGCFKKFNEGLKGTGVKM